MGIFWQRGKHIGVIWWEFPNWGDKSPSLPSGQWELESEGLARWYWFTMYENVRGLQT